MCQEIHSSVALNSTRFLQELSRYNYVTPTSYLQLLAIFSNLVGSKKQEVATARNRTKTGLEKVQIFFFVLVSPPSERSEWQKYCFRSMCVCVCVCVQRTGQ